MTEEVSGPVLNEEVLKCLDKVEKKWDIKDIKVIDISEKLEKTGLPAFLIENVLTKEETKLLIKASEEIGFQDAKEYCHLYRTRLNDRLMSDDSAFSKLIWERVKSVLPKTYRNNEWKLQGLNSRWRYCKYKEGHYFGPHTDGGYQKDDITCSFFTFMLYLNSPLDGDYEGGSTNFFSYKGKVLYEVKPKAGMAIVFPQYVHGYLHEGAELKKGVKYILRTDVMYKK